MREFLLTDKGVDLEDIYEGPDGVLVGVARSRDQKRRLSEAAPSFNEAASFDPTMTKTDDGNSRRGRKVR